MDTFAHFRRSEKLHNEEIGIAYSNERADERAEREKIERKALEN